MNGAFGVHVSETIEPQRKRSSKSGRLQKSFVTRHERAILDWICARLPEAVMPDHLTMVGFLGCVVTFVSYIAANQSRWWLFAASAGLVAYWFGDSLDGSLARYRRIERPLYGYFLDHTVDAICNLLVMAGLGFAPLMDMSASLFALTGYFLLSMYVFITNSLTGVFQLSFIGCGPTELRLMLITLNCAMFFSGPVEIPMFGARVSFYSALVFFAASVLLAIFLVQVLAGIKKFNET